VATAEAFRNILNERLDFNVPGATGSLALTASLRIFLFYGRWLLPDLRLKCIRNAKLSEYVMMVFSIN
jgi:hypothetical protein